MDAAAHPPVDTPKHDPATDCLWTSADELSRLIADGALTSESVVAAHIRQIELVEPKINAMTQRRFDRALDEARVADQAVTAGHRLPALHGVPFTVKQMIDVQGMSTGWGCTADPEIEVPVSAASVARLQAAGGIVLGKTNVPQLGIYFESDNPLQGHTNNPWNTDRTSGGSSGGEAALIAAGGTPFGVGSDLGGSIRVPAHFCGVHGLQPTSNSIALDGVHCLPFGSPLSCVVGALARHVSDLVLVFNLMADRERLGQRSEQVLPCDPRMVDVSQLRIGVWTNDDYFPVSPAISRAIAEAAATLSSLGATIEEFAMPSGNLILELYLGLLSADGGAVLRRALGRSKTDRRLTKMIRIASLGKLVRQALVLMANWSGQHIEADLVRASGWRTTNELWLLEQRLADFKAEIRTSMERGKLDAILLPPFGTPAVPHGRSMDLLVAGLYAFVPNLLGFPAGVLSGAVVRPDEESNRVTGRDRVVNLAARCEQATAGLPVGVQVMAKPWQESTVTAIMLALESASRGGPHTPAAWRPPIS